MRKPAFGICENKDANQLICVFVFAYEKCWFSQDAAHLLNKNDTPVREHYKIDISFSMSTKQSYYMPLRTTMMRSLISAFVFRC